MTLPFDRFLNLVYYFATEDAEPKDKDKFDMRLQAPDARARRLAREGRLDAGSPWSKENEESALSGLVAAMTGAV